MNSFVSDIFEKIALNASRFSLQNEKSTISSLEVQTAVLLLLPGKLAKHAVREGTIAVTKYTRNKVRNKGRAHEKGCRPHVYKSETITRVV